MPSPKDQHAVASDRTLKRTGLTGIGLGALALIACELPLILAVVGLGSLGASAATFRPSQAVEIAAIGISILGGVTMILVYVRRIMRKRKVEKS